MHLSVINMVVRVLVCLNMCIRIGYDRIYYSLHIYYIFSSDLIGHNYLTLSIWIQI
jgi:hypothetical protein